MDNEELVRIYQTGNIEVLEEIIDKNSRIIHKLANKYNGVDILLEYDDLVQIGNLGIIKAIESYKLNHERKAKFSTYAFEIINREILNYINGRGSRETKNLKFNRECKRLNQSIIYNEEEKELIEFVKDKGFNDYDDIENDLYLKTLRKDLENLMNKNLSLEIREILKLRYGWNFKPMNCPEVADILNQEEKKVRRKEKLGLNKLRATQFIRANKRSYYDNGFLDKPLINVGGFNIEMDS